MAPGRPSTKLRRITTPSLKLGRTTRKPCRLEVIAGIVVLLQACWAIKLLLAAISNRGFAAVDFERDSATALLTFDVPVLKVHSVFSASRRAISSITTSLFASITARTSSCCSGVSLGSRAAKAAFRPVMHSGKLILRERKRLITAWVSRLYTSTSVGSIRLI